MMKRLLQSATLAFLFCCLPPAETQAQVLSDSLFTWRGYSTEAVTRVRVFTAPPADTTRPRTVVLTELGASPGPSTVHDAQHLAEIIGRSYGFDPARASWVFHWGSFSFDGAAPNRHKDLFLRATFRRTAAGNLSSPQWRVIRRDAVLDLTDRAFTDS